MAEITAKLVNELRAKTGQAMMECKKMLTECNQHCFSISYPCSP